MNPATRYSKQSTSAPVIRAPQARHRYMSQLSRPPQLRFRAPAKLSAYFAPPTWVTPWHFPPAASHAPGSRVLRRLPFRGLVRHGSSARLLVLSCYQDLGLRRGRATCTLQHQQRRQEFEGGIQQASQCRRRAAGPPLRHSAQAARVWGWAARRQVGRGGVSRALGRASLSQMRAGRAGGCVACQRRRSGVELPNWKSSRGGSYM